MTKGRLGTRNKRAYLLYLLVPLLAGLDQLSKLWAVSVYGGVITLIPDWLAVRVILNHGLAFGLGAGPDGMPATVTVLVTFILLLPLIVAGWRTAPTKTMRHGGFACMIGGAMGNMVDRARHGYVVDFIDIRALPTFNLADIALLTGMALVLFDLFYTASRD